MSARSHYLFLLLVFFFSSCQKFEYNPYQSVFESSTNQGGLQLNAMNLEKLRQRGEQQKDTLSILLIGDSQRFYESLDRFVGRANSLAGLDMVILAGDISDFGLLKEFGWVISRLSRLQAPYFCVIGNHDIATDGGKIYESLFGPRNFSFSYQGCRFLFHDTNGRESGFDGSTPDIGWMASELQASSGEKIIGVSHVPPFNADFDGQLESPYKSLLASSPQFILSLHGHLHAHHDSHYYQDHVRYIVSYATGQNKALLIQIADGRIFKQILFY